MGRLFGTDGVRGIAGEELTTDLASGLGRAAVTVLGRHGEGHPVIVVGRDPRSSGEWLEDALVEGARASGGDVILAGVQTTPAVAFLTTDLGASAGAMISASHNPPEYNGIKFFASNGMKLADDLEDEIEVVLAAAPESGRRGEIRPLGGAAERYVDHLMAAAEARLDGLEVVVDCANGSASGVTAEVLGRLGASVTPIFDRPDGGNINVGCGALHPDVVAAAVVGKEADAGVAHDGDADRALFADARGEVVDGDQVLAACAIGLRDSGRLTGNRVVTTVMANLGFHHAMRDAGIEVVQTKVGDRYVLEEMLRTGAVLGGEQSGHVIFREHATTGDGVLTAVRFLSLAARTGRTVAGLAGAMRRYPQVIENVEVSDRDALGDATAVWEAVANAEAELGDDGRVLVRASGTEPLVRVMVEADTREVAEEVAASVAGTVRDALGV